MLPARQRLDRLHAHRFEIDERLIVQREVTLLDAVADLACQPEPCGAFLGDAGVEDLEGAAAELLGGAHRAVGALPQLSCVGPAVGVHGDAAAGREQHRLTLDDERSGEDIVDAHHHTLEVLARVDARQQQPEVVAAHAGHHVDGAHRLVQPLADRAQQLIAGLAAESVVHVLEAIQVEPHDGKLTLVRLDTRERALQHHREHGAVGQLRDGVDEGELLDEFFGAFVLRDVDGHQRRPPHDPIGAANRQHHGAHPGVALAGLGQRLVLVEHGLAGKDPLEPLLQERAHLAAQRLAAHRFARHARQLRGGTTHLSNDQVTIEDDDFEWRVLEDGLESAKRVVGLPVAIWSSDLQMHLPRRARKRRRSWHALSPMCAGRGRMSPAPPHYPTLRLCIGRSADTQTESWIVGRGGRHTTPSCAHRRESMPRATSLTGAPRQVHLEVAGPDRDRQTYDPLGAFETILEHSPLKVIIFDRDLVIREVSRPAAELARMPREAMRGQTLRSEVRALLQKRFERVFAGEAVFHEDKALPESSQSDAWMRTMMLPIRGADGVVWGTALMAVDVAENERAEELVEKLAFIDPVTELPNRSMLSMMLESALSGVKANQRQLAVVWLNLDRFKDVNHALGRQAGDELLRAVGERLHEAVRSVDVVARVGGDDFGLLLPRINSRKHLERVMVRIHDVFATPFVVEGESVLLSASCGIAVHPNGGADARQLRESAHSAMRAAKELGGGAFEIFDPGVAEEGSARLWLAREIRDGIEQGDFTLHYQPLVDLETMRVQSVEALARWEHPQRGLLSPAEFIPFAEESGLIVPLGRHLLAKACGHLKGWQGSLESPPRLSVNISARW